MSKLDEFLGGKTDKPEANKPEGVEWFAAVSCQTCGVDVEEQTLYPSEGFLVWHCPDGHRSFLENYRIF